MVTLLWFPLPGHPFAPTARVKVYCSVPLTGVGPSIAAVASSGYVLTPRIRALLRRGPAVRPETIQVSDLVVDTRARSVERAGREIALTAKEYALLEYLARNAEQVVGRAQIAEHVWGENFDPFSNLIEVYVQRLRRKIDDGHSCKLLRTLRGEGYKLSAGNGAK